MPRNLRAAAKGDTEDVNRERAETYLRVLAEAELRRATIQPWGTAPRDGYTARVKRVAQVLVFVGALDDGIADQILDDFELALGARQTGQIASVPGWFTQRAVERARLARRVSVPPAAAGRSAAASAGTGTTAAGRTHAPVPLGQIVRTCGAGVRGEVCLLSYARVASGPQFSVFARTRQPPGPWEPSGPRLFDPFTATDDQGTSYQVTIRDIGSPVLGWTLMLSPDPPHDPQWLDLAATTGGPAARVVLRGAAGQTRPPAATAVTVSQTAPGPGEYLLSTIAARLLAAVPPLPHDPWLYGTGPRPRELPGITGGLGDVIAALQESGALPPLSPVPGQLATLCARLDVSGHGIITPPASDLPEPWLSVLTQYQHRAPVRDGCAAAAVVLPGLDGIQLTILGLHNCEDSSTLHMHASGPACHTAYGPDELYSWPPIWICDSSGRWHATRTSGQSGMNGEIALRLEIVPPLSRATTWIEVQATGQSAEAHARLPLRWQSFLAPATRTSVMHRAAPPKPDNGAAHSGSGT